MQCQCNGGEKNTLLNCDLWNCILSSLTFLTSSYHFTLRYRQMQHKWRAFTMNKFNNMKATKKILNWMKEASWKEEQNFQCWYSNVKIVKLQWPNFIKSKSRNMFCTGAISLISSLRPYLPSNSTLRISDFWPSLSIKFPDFSLLLFSHLAGYIFSVTRRSRSDSRDLLTYLLTKR